MDEQDLKTDLIGAMKLIPASGGHQPSREELTQPLESPDSLMFGFCDGCGRIREITREGKTIFEKEFGITIPDPPTGMYLHFTRCLRCDTAYRDVEVRSIPQ